MEFGIYLRPAHTYPKMLNMAQKADKLGYFGAFLNDHVIGFGDDGKEPYLEAWTTMTGIGVETEDLRVGQIVLFNSLRNPAYLAKSIATLDNMTNGRYEVMIGAGWNDREYNGYDLMEEGRGMPSAKERVDRFEETLQILNNMLHQEVTNFDGEFWQLDNAINIPQPVQQPMRISVGCKGPRMMSITAKYANGINLSGSYIPDVIELVDKFERIVERDTENSLDDYFVSGFASIRISEDDDQLEKWMKDYTTEERSLENVRENSLIGAPDDIIEKLKRLDDRGIDMMVVYPRIDDKLSSEQLDFFMDNVIKQL